MDRIGAMMEGMAPAHVLGLVAIAGLFVLAVALIAFLILALIRRSADLAQAQAHAAAMGAELAARMAEASPLEPPPAEPEPQALRASAPVGPVWSRAPFGPPQDYAARMADSIPILALAGLKGGAGRTTLAAALASWFDMRGERVLLIDLDPAGGPSLAAPDGSDGGSSLLRGEWPAVAPLDGARSSSDHVAAGTALSGTEAHLLARWLSEPQGTAQPAPDLRYGLAQVLLGPRIQTVYDRVILDTPPRPSPALAAALCSATHLLIPTRLDWLSVTAVERFLAMLDGLRPRPLPPVQQYRLIGKQQGSVPGRLAQGERAAMGQIERLLARRAEPARLFLREALMPTLSADAWPGAALLSDPVMGPALDRLGQAVADFAPSYAEPPEE